MPFVYFIYSQKLNKYYVGACTDIERRLYEHNIGDYGGMAGEEGGPRA